MEENEDQVVFNGKPVNLIGPRIRTGQKAPDFHVIDTDWNPVTLASTSENVRLFSCVPALQIPVCNLQTQRFEQEAKEYSDVVMYTVSVDPPQDQQRYCSEYEIVNLKTVSDYPEYAFGTAYGVLIEGVNRLIRAVFVIDRDDIVRHVEYVTNGTNNIDDFELVRVLDSLSSPWGKKS